MHKSAVIFLGCFLLVKPLYASEIPSLSTDRDKVNYSIGVYMANMLKQQGVDIDPALVLKGFSDIMNDKELLLGEDELNKSVKAYQRAVRKARSGSRHNPSADNLKIGEKFLVENRSKAGVVVTKSGLQYRVIKEGVGRTPVETDTVEYNVRELLLNRKEVATSIETGKPVDAKIKDEVLPALQEALLLMKTGAKWELYVPAHLAYGEEGRGHEVPPNSALIYEVELLAIK